MPTSTMVPRPVSPDEEVAQIPQFFAGKNVFITGATGFMGKVLIERLLWTCPDIGRLHLLLREKKDVPPEKRLAQLRSSQVFDNVRAHCPHQLEKLHIIPGDTMQPNLGIQPHHLALMQEVNVVFNSAATLKFDESLDVAVEQNVVSVMRLMEICDNLPNLQALVHVSTAYSNSDLSVVEERVYPATCTPREVLAVAKTLPPDILKAITPSYISPKPNTYTFTKALAENAILEHMTRTYPIAIFRPSIVVSAVRNPYPGWVENLNGPVGVTVAAGKGLLHVFICKESAKADLIPVDIAIDTLIAVAWDTACSRPKDVLVYHGSMVENPTTWGEFAVNIRKNINEYPLDDAFWYPCGFYVETPWIQKCLEFSLQTLPLHIAEYVMRLCGIQNKLSLITVSSRLRAMAEVLKFFSVREWTFNNGNVQRLRDKLTPKDRELYNLDPRTVDWNQQFKNFVLGTRRYMLKERDQDLDKARAHRRKMYLIHMAFLSVCVMIVGRLFARVGGLQLLLTLLGGVARLLGHSSTTA